MLDNLKRLLQALEMVLLMKETFGLVNGSCGDLKQQKIQMTVTDLVS